MGKIMATEARALWLAAATEANPWSGLPRIGLDCWSPNINICRDPRWGRNVEVPSEDPMLNGDYAVNYNNGLQQGEDKRYIKVVTTLKHWAAYSLEDSDGVTRFSFDAVVSTYDLEDTYFPAFRRGILSGAKGIMCSYNSLNGIPTCASSFLKNKLRGEWKFDGYMTFDSGAIGCIYQNHNYTKTVEEAICAALVYGQCDIDSGPDFVQALRKTEASGQCNNLTDAVSTALRNTLRTRFALGLFDPTNDQPYWNIPMSEVNKDSSIQQSKYTAAQSFVLLKNDNHALPLSPGAKIALIGPSANNSAVLLGNYLGQLCPTAYNDYSCVTTILQSLQKVWSDVTYTHGCSHAENYTQGFIPALQAAENADVIVLAMGLNATLEGESNDRTAINLPGVQPQLIQVLRDTYPTKPIVLILLNGGVVAIEKEIALVDAVLEVWYPGAQGADAIAETLSGKNCPGGKLPVTMYRSDFVNEIKMSDMSMTNGVGRTYRYYKGTPIFPFGYGLSYTQFEVSAQFIDSIVTVTMSNIGKMKGSETLQVYFSPKSDVGQITPKSQLLSYFRVELEVASSALVNFPIDISKICLVDPLSGKRQVIPGKYGIQLTNGSEQYLYTVIEIDKPIPCTM